MSSPADHAATIGNFITGSTVPRAHGKQAALAALAALVTQAEQAEHFSRAADTMFGQKVAAEARADQLQRERDEALGLLTDVRTECRGLIEQRQEYRERAERAETALRLYVGYTESVKQDPDYDMDGVEWEDIYLQAHAALADSGEPSA